MKEKNSILVKLSHITKRGDTGNRNDNNTFFTEQKENKNHSTSRIGYVMDLKKTVF